MWTVLQADRTAHPELRTVACRRAIDSLYDLAQTAGRRPGLRCISLWLWLYVGLTKAEASAPGEIVSPPRPTPSRFSTLSTGTNRASAHGNPRYPRDLL